MPELTMRREGDATYYTWQISHAEWLKVTPYRRKLAFRRARLRWLEAEKRRKREG